jgi:hypothetical protein
MAFLPVNIFMGAFLMHVWPFNGIFTSEYLHECLPHLRVTIQWPFHQWVSSWVPFSFTCDHSMAFLLVSIFMSAFLIHVWPFNGPLPVNIFMSAFLTHVWPFVVQNLLSQGITI